MKNTALKDIQTTMDEDTTPTVTKHPPVKEVKHFVGTYTDKELGGAQMTTIVNSLTSDHGFTNLKYMNQRKLASGNTEVWLSSHKGDFTTNCIKKDNA